MKITWLSTNRQLMLSQDVHRTDRGLMVDDSPTIMRRYAQPALPQAQAPVETSGGCGNKVHRWLGIRWYGVPMLKRFRYDPAIGIPEWRPETYLGCGCIVKLKAITQAVGFAWKA